MIHAKSNGNWFSKFVKRFQFEEFDVSWAGPGRNDEELCLGTEDGKVLFTTLEGEITGRTLSEWLNLLIETGFHIERLEEPCASDEIVRAHPSLQDTQVVGYFLHVRVSKPAGCDA